MLTLSRLYSFLTDYNNKTPISDIKVDTELDQFITAINIKRKELATGDSPYTILDTDDYEIWLIDASGGNVSVTFAAAADHENELMWFIRTDATGNAVSVNSVSMTLQYGMEIFYSDGTSWLNIAFPTTLASHQHLTGSDGGSLVHKFKEDRAKFTYNGVATVYTIKVAAAQYYNKDKFCWWDQEITTLAAVSAGADLWHYLYIDYSTVTSGTELTNANFTWSDDPPSFDQTTRSWLRTVTNTDDRCIMACITNAGDTDFSEFFHDGADFVLYANDSNDLNSVDVDTAWVDVTLTIPVLAEKASCFFRSNIVNGTCNLYWRTNGQVGSGGHLVANSSFANLYQDGAVEPVFVDSNQKIEVKHDASNGNTVTVLTRGWHFPIGI